MVKIKRQLQITKDGSHTLYIPELDEHYHSVHGAIQEAMHIYLQAGFHYNTKNPIHILEVGFGTGLNTYLTLIEAKKTRRKVYYHTIELYPLEEEESKQLNYPEQIEFESKDIFSKIHAAQWNTTTEITTYFHLHKIHDDLTSHNFEEIFDVIYFDAFAPDVQPQLWTTEIFQKIHAHLAHDAVLTTYSTKGVVKRALRSAGYQIKRLPGPPGKREMLRAIPLTYNQM